MRVTAEVKAATRQRILEAATKLFAEKGFDATTTRDIAEAAQIATGTLFNYFATKEAIIAQQADAASEHVHDAYFERPENGETLEEDLFGLLAAGLRRLKPLRRQLPSLLETTLSPLAEPADRPSGLLRTRHLEAVSQLAMRHGHRELTPVSLQLYWTLYTGILVFWANDKSPKQEETLALVDQSLNMFVSWLRDHDQPVASRTNRSH